MWYEKQNAISSFSFQNKQKGLATFYQQSCITDNPNKQIKQKILYPRNKQIIKKQRLSRDFSHSYLLKVLNENQNKQIKQIKQQRKTHDPHKSLLPKINEQLFKKQRNQKKQKIHQIKYRFNRVINKTQHYKDHKNYSVTLTNSKKDIQLPIQSSQNKIKTAGVKYMQFQQNKIKNIDFDINQQQYLKKKIQNNRNQKISFHERKISYKNFSRAISESEKLFTNIVIKKSLEKIIQDRKLQQNYLDLKQIKLNHIQFPVTGNVVSTHISPHNSTHISNDKLNNYDLLDSFYKKIKDKENQQRKTLKKNCKVKQFSIFQSGLK